MKVEIEKRVDETKTIQYYKKGTDILHRDDGPAVIQADGTKEWYQNGERHREDGPAVIESNGTEYWYRHGKKHRDDGPAVIWKKAEIQLQYQNDKKYKNILFWYQNGKKHRDDGPAEIYDDGSEYWFQHGKLHREDGPAIIKPDGTKKYYLNGKKYSKKDHKEKLIANEFFFQDL